MSVGSVAQPVEADSVHDEGSNPASCSAMSSSIGSLKWSVTKAVPQPRGARSGRRETETPTGKARPAPTVQQADIKVPCARVDRLVSGLGRAFTNTDFIHLSRIDHVLKQTPVAAPPTTPSRLRSPPSGELPFVRSSRRTSDARSLVQALCVSLEVAASAQSRGA